MKNLIILLISSFLFIGCATWNKKSQVNEEKNSGSEISTKSGTADTKIKRTITDFSQTTSGKMNLSILPGNSESQDPDTPKTQRKLKVKDTAGNEAEYDLNGNETVQFGSETVSKTLLNQVQDSISVLQNNFEKLQKDFSEYKKQKNTESKKTGIQLGGYLTLLGLGVCIIVVLGLLFYFGKFKIFKSNNG
ncbi:hypothetical protein HZP35_17600 [Elizabethkingia anophelis]|nr:hypothetical protein [Elizabethkingia anophelis]MCT4156754.1 hypothetical protein [Elizabethkingia anophelis]MCT4171075.1 hypothetical protein [Elizabethkingia anophelis]MCT4245490.1 hypothetical protein [Elizabethkingia anophelis]MCT4249223.1 hypothetical protein [Elizabethkingia anophelis]